MSEREEWPAWARQSEAPIAVSSPYEYLRRPDGRSFNCAVYADGTVLREPGWGTVECQTPAQVRQIMAALEFPGDDDERLDWVIALRLANARRETLPAPVKEDA